MKTPNVINNEDESTNQNAEKSVTLDIAQSSVVLRGTLDEATLCQCLHCGKMWIPNKPNPNKCPRCHSLQWNRPRLYKIAGAPEPGEKPKARGRSFARGEANPYFQQKRNQGDADTKKTQPES